MCSCPALSLSLVRYSTFIAWGWDVRRFPQLILSLSHQGKAAEMMALRSCVSPLGPSCGSYSRFGRAIELHEMARDDKSIHHRPLSSSSHIVIVSLPRLVLASRPSVLLAPSCFPSCLSSRHCFSSLLIVVPIRAVIVFIVYHPLLLIYPLISPLSLPFLIAPYSPIAALRSPPLRSYPYRPSSSLPDGETS